MDDLKYPTESLLATISSYRNIVEDRPPTIFQMQELEYISVSVGEPRQKGDLMKERAGRFNACLTLLDAKRIWENQKDIPSDLRKRFILFFGTIVASKTGRKYFPFLWYIERKWEIDLGPLDRDWEDEMCVVPRLRKA